MDVLEHPLPDDAARGDDLGPQLRVRRQLADRRRHRLGVAEPRGGEHSQRRRAPRVELERGAQLGDRRRPPPREQLPQLLLAALDDRGASADLAREPDRLSADLRADRVGGVVHKVGEQLPFPHQAERPRCAAGCCPLDDPLREAGERGAYRGRAVAPERFELLGELVELGAMEHLGAHRGQPAVPAGPYSPLVDVVALAVHDPLKRSRTALEPHGGDAEAPGCVHVGGAVVADVNDLARLQGELAQHHLPETARLAHAMRARHDHTVHGHLVGEERLEQLADLGLRQIRLGDRDHLPPELVREADQLEHVEVRREQLLLDLDLDPRELGGCEVGDRGRRQLGVDVAKRDLRSTAGSVPFRARARLGRATQHRELLGGEVRAQSPLLLEPQADERERVDRLGHATPEHRVEDVERQHARVIAGQESKRGLEPRVRAAALECLVG